MFWTWRTAMLSGRDKLTNTDLVDSCPQLKSSRKTQNICMRCAGLRSMLTTTLLNPVPITERARIDYSCCRIAHLENLTRSLQDMLAQAHAYVYLRALIGCHSTGRRFGTVPDRRASGRCDFGPTLCKSRNCNIFGLFHTLYNCR